MATQTGSIDLTASNDAAKTATSYVTEVTGQNGIMVHPSTDDDTGVRITSDVDIRQDDVSIANFGALDSNDNPTARVGKADGKHVLIDPDYVYIMDGSTPGRPQLAKFGEFVRIGSDTDPMLDIRDGWMYFYPTGDDIQSLYFGSTSRIQRPLNGALKVSSDVALSLVGPTLGLDDAGGTAQSFAMANVIAMLSTASANLTRGSAAASWSDGIVRKSGKVVTMTINAAKLSSALASGSTSGSIATIPTGYRPANLQRGAACIGTTGNYANVWFVASNTGNVAIANRSSLSIPTTAEISLQITYVIA